MPLQWLIPDPQPVGSFVVFSEIYHQAEQARSHVEQTWDHVLRGNSTLGEKLEFGGEALGLLALSELSLSCFSLSRAGRSLPKLAVMEGEAPVVSQQAIERGLGAKAPAADSTLVETPSARIAHLKNPTVDDFDHSGLWMVQGARGAVGDIRGLKLQVRTVESALSPVDAFAMQDPRLVALQPDSLAYRYMFQKITSAITPGEARVIRELTKANADFTNVVPFPRTPI